MTRGRTRYVMCPNPECKAVFVREYVIEAPGQRGWVCEFCEEECAGFVDYHPTEDASAMPSTALGVLEQLVMDCLDSEEIAWDSTGRLYGVFVDALRYLVKEGGHEDLAYEQGD